LISWEVEVDLDPIIKNIKSINIVRNIKISHTEKTNTKKLIKMNLKIGDKIK